MTLTTIKLAGRTSRAKELHVWLREAILDGRVRSGERLVEEQIAAMASVSRTPVREAIRLLEAEGLVEDFGSGPVAVTLTSEALAEMCEVREALEALSSRLVAMGRSEMTVLALEGMTERWAALIESDASSDEFVRLNNAFHEMIWQASGNRYLVGQLRILRSRIESSGATTLRNEDRRTEAMAEHAALLEAIRNRDADLASDLAGSHFRKAMAIRLAEIRFAAPMPA
jgi:DNA-binding GntR family transcriptional regulator